MSAPRQTSRSPRPRLILGLAVAVVLVGAASAAYGAFNATRKPQWNGGSPAAAASSNAADPSPSQTAAAVAEAITLTATGDNVMGGPGNMPPNGGNDLYTKVKPLLKGDLVMGNLEEPVTEDTGYRKCGADSTSCHQFYVPPSWAKHLKNAGYQLMNMANNHGNDMGAKGYTNTQKSLEAVGLKHTGAPGEITVVDVKGIKVAVVGFSSYAWNNSLINISKAKQLIQQADQQADLVVVQVHMGAEGTAYTHVKPGTEMFLGENRGNPIAFSHAMIDAGADLIVGHGPHVLRAMEFYKGRLIAYSLGNFLGGGRTLKPDGVLGYTGVLKVQLTKDGTWVGGQFDSAIMNSVGVPGPDAQKRGATAIRNLTKSDFPTTGPKIESSGKITPPAA
ncbi:MAG: CapA family protein [Hamadaea sp.]|uniref:CapA family protein n=1 Tax=Hamadaea sp. NPDC050747 TaxID=3155789 RepID=UPI001836A612|nr:CapA family protein [Hamadaea sp.]NUR48661.1 CapA family protein [Hamadaea sp.]